VVGFFGERIVKKFLGEGRVFCEKEKTKQKKMGIQTHKVL